MGGSGTEIDALFDALIGEGLIKAEGVRGCTDDEVAAVLATEPSVSPPPDYADFLRRAGRGADRVFRGSDLFYPVCLEAQEAAREAAETDMPELRTEGRFFIGHHQGYVFYFFEAGDPRVWIHTEGDPAPVADAATMADLLRRDAEVLRELDRRARARRGG
ncbi:SMI1/KNR4 family protein [Allonocardiopsis opalescens]|uniref:SMI1/KNR4 family protein n=1 Tax=Allonocardiopsis opalescens TaxID=1144618 RepID=A0A2T0QD06_9ACTN|nr:SMI1/KNR4 family protein [Allonocardiopsis opalescens]PRY01836.1 hypothetical protein CLV72_101433 [Allonocardiopsis opalescens]